MSSHNIIKRYLPSSLSRWSSLPQYSYRSVPEDGSEEGFGEFKTRHILRRSQWSAWLPLGICCSIVVSAIVFGIMSPRASREFPAFSPKCKQLLSSAQAASVEAGLIHWVVKTHPVIFEQNEIYAAPVSSESNTAWDSLIPGEKYYKILTYSSQILSLISP